MIEYAGRRYIVEATTTIVDVGLAVSLFMTLVVSCCIIGIRDFPHE